MVVRLRALLASIYPHALGLAGIATVAIGVGNWVGWYAGAITAGLPFAGFYIAGQAIEVMRYLPKGD